MARIDTTTERTSTAGAARGTIGPGIAAGIAGAIVMGLIWAIVAAAMGVGFFTPLMLIGATYLGIDWMDVPIWAAVLGLVTHLVFGAAFGVLFVALTRNITNAGARIAVAAAPPPRPQGNFRIRRVLLPPAPARKGVRTAYPHA